MENGTCSNKKACCKKACCIGAIIFGILLAVGTAFLTTELIQMRTMKNEIELYGSKQNYDLIQEANKTQIQAYIKQLDGAAPTTEQAAAPQAAASGTITDENLALITSLYGAGEDNAEITIFEFSNLGCSYCKRHHNDGTLASVAEQSDKNVAYYVWINEGYNPDQSKATACAGVLGGTEGYLAAKNHFFSDGNLLDVASVAWVDQDALTTCMATTQPDELFSKVTALSNTYGLTGTPSHLVINNETKEYVAIPGAYPAAQFLAAIDQLTK